MLEQDDTNPARGPLPDERTYWSPARDSGGRVVDVDPIDPDPVRLTRQRRESAPPQPQPNRQSLAEDDEPIQRIGGRRVLRPEFVLLIASAVFLVGALVKPWPNPALHAGSPSPRFTEAPPVVIAAASSPTGYSDVPPWDDRYPFFGNGTVATPPDVQVGVPGDLAAAWLAVDWSVLRTSDQHSGWGFAAAVLPDVADAGAGQAASAPATSWTSAAGSSPTTASVPIVSGRSVYALAVTWPANLKVSSVTFLYLGGPDHPPYLPPPGFPPFTQVSPIPAESVASPSTAGGPPAGAPAAEIGALRSGQFWIPPSDASWNPTARSVPEAWQSLPWAWPNGTYRVTVTSEGVPTILELHLQQIG